MAQGLKLKKLQKARGSSLRAKRERHQPAKAQKRRRKREREKEQGQYVTSRQAA